MKPITMDDEYAYPLHMTGSASTLPIVPERDFGAELRAVGAGYINQAQGQSCESAKQRPEATVSVTLDVRAVRNFADALMGACDGKRITRAGWNAGGQYVAMQIPDKGSKMTSPYLYLKNAQNQMVPWVPSQGDLFASDWAILPRGV